MAEWDKRQYIVPANTSPVGTIIRAICVPNDRDWIATVNGALHELTIQGNWNVTLEDGQEADTELATAVAFAMYRSYIFEECTTLTCEQIIDCIENNPATGVALQAWMSNNGYGDGSGTYDTPSTYNDNPILADGSAIAGCDNDNLFGAITQLVDLMHNVLTDVFEQVEVSSNYLERTQLLISGIPALGLLPIDEFVDFIDQLISAIAENYAAQYTLALRDEYRCDLFCLVKDTCEFDFQIFTDYFMGRVGSVISQENLIQGLEWFISGVWTGAQVVHAAHALICSVLAYGSRFFSIDMAWLSRTVTASMNDPDPDWTTLCLDCPDISSTPVLDATSCYGDGSGTLEHVSGIRWRLTGEFRGGSNDYAAFIRRADGGAFHLSNGALISGTNPFFFTWQTPVIGCSAGLTPPSWETTDFLHYGWTGAGAAGVWVIEFDFQDT